MISEYWNVLLKIYKNPNIFCKILFFQNTLYSIIHGKLSEMNLPPLVTSRNFQHNLSSCCHNPNTAQVNFSQLEKGLTTYLVVYSHTGGGRVIDLQFWFKQSACAALGFCRQNSGCFSPRRGCPSVLNLHGVSTHK